MFVNYRIKILKSNTLHEC